MLRAMGGSSQASLPVNSPAAIEIRTTSSTSARRLWRSRPRCIAAAQSIAAVTLVELDDHAVAEAGDLAPAEALGHVAQDAEVRPSNGLRLLPAQRRREPGRTDEIRDEDRAEALGGQLRWRERAAARVRRSTTASTAPRPFELLGSEVGGAGVGTGDLGNLSGVARPVPSSAGVAQAGGLDHREPEAVVLGDDDVAHADPEGKASPSSLQLASAPTRSQRRRSGTRASHRSGAP